MTKEDKQIIDRGIKENWRIGDRTRLKHLLEKNLKLYRENVELERENAELKRIVKMVAMINTGIYTNEGIKAIYEQAEQFLKEIEK